MKTDRGCNAPTLRRQRRRALAVIEVVLAGSNRPRRSPLPISLQCRRLAKHLRTSLNPPSLVESSSAVLFMASVHNQCENRNALSRSRQCYDWQAPDILSTLDPTSNIRHVLGNLSPIADINLQFATRMTACTSSVNRRFRARDRGLCYPTRVVAALASESGFPVHLMRHLRVHLWM